MRKDLKPERGGPDREVQVQSKLGKNCHLDPRTGCKDNHGPSEHWQYQPHEIKGVKFTFSVLKIEHFILERNMKFLN